MRTATPAVADSVAYPARQMSAAEFVEFWRSVRLVAMATVGPAGQPHIAPVHAELAGTMLRLRIYEDTVRRQDLATNPRVAFTTCWDIARDETRRDRDRLEASRLLADRGWGKAPTFAAIDEPDPLDLANMEQAAEEFRAAILRLAPNEPDNP
jgi:Pyridoxamine 5'-phosphate oxidase